MKDFEEKYLYNFTEKEKAQFRKQSQREQRDFSEWENKFYTALFSEATYIFGNYDPRPFSKLDVKYTINRLAMNDPTLIHLPFNYGDEVAGNSDAIKIANAIQSNTHCQSYEFGNCGFSDRGAQLILKALKKKPVSIFLWDKGLTEATWQYAAQLMSNPNNRWKTIELGPVKPSDQTKTILHQLPRVRIFPYANAHMTRLIQNHLQRS